VAGIRIAAAVGRLRKWAWLGSEIQKNIPQGLKPHCYRAFFGTTEVVPFQNDEFLAAYKVVP
jgi:hypothetical protein